MWWNRGDEFAKFDPSSPPEGIAVTFSSAESVGAPLTHAAFLLKVTHLSTSSAAVQQHSLLQAALITPVDMNPQWGCKEQEQSDRVGICKGMFNTVNGMFKCMRGVKVGHCWLSSSVNGFTHYMSCRRNTWIEPLYQSDQWGCVTSNGWKQSNPCCGNCMPGTITIHHSEGTCIFWCGKKIKS